MANKLTDEQRDKLAHYANQMIQGSWTNNSEFIRWYRDATGEDETFQGFNIGVDERLKKATLALAAKHKVKEVEQVLPPFVDEVPSEELPEVAGNVINPYEPVFPGEERSIVLDEEKPKDEPKPVQTQAKKK